LYSNLSHIKILAASLQAKTKQPTKPVTFTANKEKGSGLFMVATTPEDYRHLVGDNPTDLSLFPTSPGYRLILNNLLFPEAKKKKRKT